MALNHAFFRPPGLIPALLRLGSLSPWRELTTETVTGIQFGSTSANQVACLTSSRGVLQVTGSGTLPFLQGLVTNDTRILQEGGAPGLVGLNHCALYLAFLTPQPTFHAWANTFLGKSIYAAILTAKGKYLHDLFLHSSPDSQIETCFLDVDASGLQDLMSLLVRYRLRKPLQITDVSSRYQVWQEFGPSATSLTGWPVDPRLPQLGWRTVVSTETVPLLPPLSSAPDAAGAAAAAYHRWRVELGVAEGDVEVPDGKATPLEFNLDALHGISFHKGCYVGQERQSYTHYRGVIRRRLMPARLHRATGMGIHPGMEVAELQDSGALGQVLGTIRSVSGGLALMHVKLAPALDPRVRVAVVGAEGVEVRPYVPEWWPPEFTLLDAAGGAQGLDMEAGEKS